MLVLLHKCCSVFFAQLCYAIFLECMEILLFHPFMVPSIEVAEMMELASSKPCAAVIGVLMSELNNKFN
jgi:hypothetical protein